jgi:hypothetical protein
MVLFLLVSFCLASEQFPLKMKNGNGGQGLKKMVKKPLAILLPIYTVKISKFL